MPKGVKYRLCGGTFFTLLSNARLPMLSKAENYAGNRSGRTEPELLWALTRVVRLDSPLKPEIVGKSLTDGTRDFKTCISWGHGYFELGNKSVQRAFDGRVRTQYSATLDSMAKVVRDFIDVGSSTKKDEYLVKALVEVLHGDDEIDENQLLYVQADGTPLRKSDVCSAREICLQPFLLGLWHYVIVGVGENTVGKETYNDWCPSKSRATRTYEKTIGEDSKRDIKLKYMDIPPIDKEIMESELLESKQSTEQTDAVNEFIPPQQNVNNPFVFNFKQEGNGNTQIGHVENYYADKRGQ